MVTTVKGATLNRGVNVIDHGAVGDGTTDDTAAFTAANTYANTYGYGYIYVPPGSYYMPSAPSDDLYYKLHGEGTLLIGTVQWGLAQKGGLSVNNNNVEVTGGFLAGGQGPGPDGMMFSSGPNPGWTVIKPTRFGSVNLNQFYANGVDFTAYASASNVLSQSAGKPFDDDIIDVDDAIYWGTTKYLVAAKIDATNIQVKTTAGADPGFTTYADVATARAAGALETGTIVYAIAVGKCDVASNVVTWRSGDIFHNNPAGTLAIKINGVMYRNGFSGVTVTADSNTQVTITGASVPDATNVDFVYKGEGGSPFQCGVVIQGRYGSDEEAFYQYISTRGRFHIESSIAGDGKYMPIMFRTGPQADADDYFAEQNDNTSSRVSAYVDEVGRWTLGNGFSGAPTPARFNVVRHLPTTTVNIAAGTTKDLNTVFDHRYQGDSTFRQLRIGSYNDFQGFYLQSTDNGDSGQGLQIQPYEAANSKLFIGKKSSTIPDAKVVIGDPTAGSPAHAAAIAPAQDGKYSVGTASQGFTTYYLPGGLLWSSGSGTPEGSLTAPVGSIYSRTDGGAGTSMYVKESGAGNTGWVAK